MDFGHGADVCEKMLCVDAISIVNDQNLGRIRLVVQEEGFSWSSKATGPLSVHYSHIRRYGTCICKHGHLSRTCLFVSCCSSNDTKPDQLSVHLIFEDESVLIAVLKYFLEFVDGDPQHHVTSIHLSKEIEAPFLPHTESQDDSPVSCIATSFVRTHVTVLRFVGNLLLAGVGDFLQIFRKGDKGDCWTCLMKCQVFQGQHIHGLQISANGYLLIYGGRNLRLFKLLNLSKHRIRSIYSFSAPDWVLDCVWLENEQAAMLTANNALVLYNLSVHQPVRKTVHYCYERCILYSGTILGRSWNEITVLAGTVFSTIVIWINSGDNQSKEAIHRLEGHKGVIFSITFCKKIQRLCSTSDDRTVRVWDVAFEEPCNWKTCKISLKFTLYGHSARVWKSSLLECGRVVSVGEDSCICLWDSNGTLETQFNGHQEGEIWSLDVSEQLNLIATGGSDGGISLWPMKKAQSPYELKFHNEKLKPKCVGLSADGQPWMVSWTGDIFLFCDSTWKLCLSEPGLSSYCLHAVTQDHQLIAFGGITGHLIICRLVGDSLLKIVTMHVCEGRIFSLVWISSSSIVICGASGNFSLWKLSYDSPTLTKETDFTLPPSKERWVTACCANEKYLVCGDRCGSLYLYAKNEGPNNPVHTMRKIHGCNGVTDIKFFNGNFISTGRDGKCREFIIEHNKLVLMRCCKLKLDWVAAVYDSNLLGRVLFCFHETSFIIWKMGDRQDIVKIDCGGGHRSWDCVISSKQEKIFMTFIKGKSVSYCCIPIEDVICQPLLRGNHPKSINSADFVNLLRGPSDGKWILLGGEDTTLRLVSVDKDDQTELRVLQRHLSSVRAVACHHSVFDDFLYIASGGGRGQLVLWKVHLSQNTMKSNVDDLDVLELNSHSVIPKMKKGVSVDAAEMRIMDLQLYQTSSDSVMLAACCSDGMLRIFSYSVKSNDIVEIQTLDCQNCLLKVCASIISTDPFLIATTTSGVLLIYSIQSSGLLSSDVTIPRITVSETGINSCDYSEEKEKLIVACAGDDAVVNILLFDRDSCDMSLKLIDKWAHNAAHSCQVSGLKMVENLMFTVALDQRLAVFSWKVSGKLIHAEMIRRVELCVPDIHGLLVWPRFKRKSFYILAYGLGTQLLSLSVA